MDKKKTQEIGAFLTTGLSVAANFGFNLNPDTLSLLNSFSPLLQLSFERVLELFCNKKLVDVELARFSISTSEALKTIKSNEKRGRVFNERFFSGRYSKTDEILEAAIRAAINDAQSIKSIFYGRLIGNVLFQDKYDESSIYTLLKVAAQLSYDELCLLYILDGEPGHRYEQLISKADDDINAQEFVQYLLHFKGLGLVTRIPPHYLGATLDSLKISTLGHDLVSLLELKSLDGENCDAMRNLLLSSIHV